VWLAHAILDYAVDRYLPVIDELDSQIADLENDVLRIAGTKQGPPVLRKTLAWKRMLLTLRRLSIHPREILLRLTRGQFDEIPREAMPRWGHSAVLLLMAAIVIATLLSSRQKAWIGSKDMDAPDENAPETPSSR
jgi:hypothetical protein